ncbi:MAG: hypothetical protein Kow0037_00160 [Calditrichia bacterium]
MGVALLLGIIWSSGCDRAAPKTELNDLQWLLGTWKLEKNDRAQFEEWERLNDSTFLGRGFLVTENDTTITEKLQLKMIDGKLTYIADVPHNAGPVSFYFTRRIGNQILFENPYHDFPQTIRYALPADGLLQVEVSGTNPETGEAQSLPFRFRKIETP